MRTRLRQIWVLFFLITLTLPLFGSAQKDFPAVMSIRQRKAVVDDITQKRLNQLLPKVLKEASLDMWIIICNEDNYDPVFNTMIPYDAWCPITQILVLADAGKEKGIERLNISRTNMEGFHTTAWNPNPDAEGKVTTQWERLAGVIKERDPKKIGINESEVIWAADGLTVTLKNKLVNAIGPVYTQRLSSAEQAATLWLETLLDEELDLFHHAVSISHALIAETFSNKVITPGITTTDDLVFHYRQRFAELGMQKAFRPFFRVWARHPDVEKKYGRDNVIRRGDVLHCDVGIKYLRYNTDTQELAYVLLPGETDVPAGLKAGMAESNRLQDVFCGEFRTGLSGNQILGRILSKAKEKNINMPKVYSHSLGYYLHEPGPLIGLPWEQVDTGGRGEVKLVPNSTFTVELSANHIVPEWGDKEVRFPLEQDIVFTGSRVIYLDGRQTKFHIIH